MAIHTRTSLIADAVYQQTTNIARKSKIENGKQYIWSFGHLEIGSGLFTVDSFKVCHT